MHPTRCATLTRANRMSAPSAVVAPALSSSHGGLLKDIL